MTFPRKNQNLNRCHLLFCLIAFLARPAESGQFFIGRRGRFRLHSKNKHHLLHGKHIENSFSFKVGFEKDGKLGLKRNQTTGEHQIILESENGVEASVNSYFNGLGFDTENHPQIRQRLETRTDNMRWKAMQKMNLLHSVRIPELLRYQNENSGWDKNHNKQSISDSESTHFHHNNSGHNHQAHKASFNSQQNHNSALNQQTRQSQNNKQQNNWGGNTNKTLYNNISRKSQTDSQYFDSKKRTRKSGSILFNIHSHSKQNSNHSNKKHKSRFYGSEKLVSNGLSSRSRSVGLQQSQNHYQDREHHFLANQGYRYHHRSSGFSSF